MELGLIVDDRQLGQDDDYTPELTDLGRNVATALLPLFKETDLSFNENRDLTWDMTLKASSFNSSLKAFFSKEPEKTAIVRSMLINMKAVGLMLNFLYRYERKAVVVKSEIYSNFFAFDYVKRYCDSMGIDAATDTGAEHRCPFLLNILEALGIIEQRRSEIEVKKFVVCKSTMNLEAFDEPDETLERKISKFAKKEAFSDDELVAFREAYGASFLTDNYYLTDFKIII